MVGDRKHDVAAAAARHANPTLGVLWHYCSRKELATGGPGLSWGDERLGSYSRSFKLTHRAHVVTEYE